MPLVGKRADVRRLRLANPHWSLGDIASETGISRERVRQILEAEGLRTRRLTPRAVLDGVIAQMPAPTNPADPAENPTDQPDEAKNDESETSPVTRSSLLEGSGSERDV